MLAHFDYSSMQRFFTRFQNLYSREEYLDVSVFQRRFRGPIRDDLPESEALAKALEIVHSALGGQVQQPFLNGDMTTTTTLRALLRSMRFKSACKLVPLLIRAESKRNAHVAKQMMSNTNGQCLS